MYKHGGESHIRNKIEYKQLKMQWNIMDRLEEIIQKEMNTKVGND